MRARAFPLYSRALLLRIVCSVGLGRLGCYRSFIPWHRPRPLCSWLIMSPDSFAPAFAFAFSRLSDSEPLRPWLLVVAFAFACIRSASMQKSCSVFVSCSCSFLQKYLLFCLFYTQKRTKCTLFRIFCAKYLAVSKKSITFAAHLKKSSDRRRAEPWPSLIFSSCANGLTGKQYE